MNIKSEPNEHEKALFKRTEKYVKYLTWIPGLQMVAVCNSLAMYATHKDSDIDMFIVARDGRLWTVRFFVTLLLTLLGVRRKKEVAGNFCLSFFITDRHLSLGSIALENDIYLAYWIATLKPIFVRDNIFERFQDANTWFTLDYQSKPHTPTFIKFPHRNTLVGGIIEALLRPIFLMRTRWSYRKLNQPEGIIIKEDMLKFHPLDRRREIRDTIFGKNFDKL